MFLNRRALVAAAAGTLAATAVPRKPHAASLSDLKRLDPPEDLPDGVFTAADGSTHSLSAFKGRGMVVNFWATWCVPCVAEMPSLAALALSLAPDDIAVLPLSSDRGGSATVATWFAAHDITSLPILLDPKGTLARAFGVRGIPTTIIIDTANRQVARLEGTADWDSSAARKLIRDLVAG